MDDTLEHPNAQPKIPLGDDVVDGDEQASDEEDAGPDWTKLVPKPSRPVIPKRGEKQHEPAEGGETNLQQHVLQRARDAMFMTLRTTRMTSNKAISYAIWHPSLARAHVTVARGVHFSSIGHSAPRPVITADGSTKYQKRMELLPEEAIYLIERGSVFCWKETNLDLAGTEGLEDVLGAPMTVQQTYTEMIGKEDLTLERFQVYAYLKRLGYVVTRASPPDSVYPTAAPFSSLLLKRTQSVLQRISSIFPVWTSRLFNVFQKSFDWWRPLRISRWFHHDKNYGSIFRSLRFMSAGHQTPLPPLPPTSTVQPPSPYKIFWNLYKPPTPFRKTAPPAPDFQIVVINARTTPMPTLRELTDLFDVSPEVPPPKPRRRVFPANTASSTPPSAPVPPVAAVPPPPPPTTYQKILAWIFPSRRPTEATKPGPPPRRPNPFAALKAGRKLVIIAVVDAGSMSFFRFSEGTFTEWPMA